MSTYCRVVTRVMKYLLFLLPATLTAGDDLPQVFVRPPQRPTNHHLSTAARQLERAIFVNDACCRRTARPNL